jgi:hypothetical protein
MRVNRGEPAYQRGEWDTEKRVDEQVHGAWWIFGHEDFKAEGTALMFAEGLIWLDLDADPWQDVIGDEVSRELRTVYGETATGLPMSLHAVRFIGGQEERFAGRAHVRYVADRLIYGAHADNEEQIEPSALSLSYRGLREWLLSSTAGVPTPLSQVNRVPSSDADEDDSPVRMEEWEQDRTVQVDGVVVETSAAKRLRTGGRFRSIYDTSAVLRLRSAGPVTLAEWRRRWVESLRDLVLFATREQTVVLYIRWHDPAYPHSILGVYSPPDTQIGPPDHSEYYQRDLLPPGIWGEGGFAELLESWRGLYLSLGSVATSLFEVLNTADMPPLTRLLRLTACAEGYHRVLHNERPFTPEAHDEMVDAMLNALPDDRTIRDQYRAPLKYANDQSQRKRLRWLIERAAQADTRLESQANAITGQLVDWRNDQTHLDKAREAPPLDELLLLNAVLTYVLEANILLDLGIGDDTYFCLRHGHVWDDPIPTWLEAHPATGNRSQPSA